MTKRSSFNALDIGDTVRIIIDLWGNHSDREYTVVEKCPKKYEVLIREVGLKKDLKLRYDARRLYLVPDARRTAAAMNASGAFRPFTVVGKK